jgi:hypothetical protein
MFPQLVDVWSWYDPDAFTIGASLVLAWWFVGLTVGWVFDLIRKS